MPVAAEPLGFVATAIAMLFSQVGRDNIKRIVRKPAAS